MALINDWLLTWLKRYITLVDKVAFGILILSFRCKVAKHSGKVDFQEDSKNLLGEIAVFDELGAFHAIELFTVHFLSLGN